MKSCNLFLEIDPNPGFLVYFSTKNSFCQKDSIRGLSILNNPDSCAFAAVRKIPGTAAKRAINEHYGFDYALYQGI